MARKPTIVGTEAQERALTDRQRETRHRALAAISDLRNGDEKSLKRAARRNHTTPETVKRYAKSALRKTPSGRYRATKQDSLLRRMVLPSPDGPRVYTFSGPGASLKASLGGKYHNAMLRALKGDDAALVKLWSRSGDQLSALDLEQTRSYWRTRRIADCSTISIPRINWKGRRRLATVPIAATSSTAVSAAIRRPAIAASPIRSVRFAITTRRTRDVSEGVCSYCGRRGEIERHHLAGFANVRSLRAPACRTCHRELGIRLEDAGVILDREASRHEHDRAWALLVGASELVVAVNDEDHEPACAVRRMKLAAGRALHEASGYPVGPNPVTAARRDERRKRERDPRPTPAPISIETATVALAQRLAAAAHAWTIGLGDGLPLPDDLGRLVDRLERYPRLDELRAIPEALVEIVEAAVLEPMSAADVDDLERRLRAWLDLFGAVASAGTDEEAFSLMDAVPDDGAAS